MSRSLVDHASESTTHALARPRRGRFRTDPRAQARIVWFGVAAGVNVLMAVVAAERGRVVDHAVTASLLVFCIAVAARHDGIVRVAFAVGRLIRSYRLHQLTYHLGQLHRATAITGMAWLLLAIAVATRRGDTTGRTIGALVLALLVVIMWTARDAVRNARHDRFEAIHRYLGWTTLVFLVVLVVRHVARSSVPSEAGVADAVGEPAVLLLALLVALVAHPWLGVKRLPCRTLGVTSDVVVLELPGKRSLGEFVRVSRDGKEWHAFAVAVTGSEGSDQFSLVIRRAGDWTDQLARDCASGASPGHLFVRRLRGHGFMHHAQTYERVLFVATGAGIGPVLAYLVGPSPVDYVCLWIGRNHYETIGHDIVARVMASGQVALIDTSAGRPDIGGLVAEYAPYFDAVFVVSNWHVRDEVARACQRLNVPWYGPTFDS